MFAERQTSVLSFLRRTKKFVDFSNRFCVQGCCPSRDLSTDERKAPGRSSHHEIRPSYWLQHKHGRDGSICGCSQYIYCSNERDLSWFWRNNYRHVSAWSIIISIHPFLYHLYVPNLTIYRLTSTAASVSSASVPSAALVLLLVVLSAIDAPVQDVSLLFAIDWFVWVSHNDT